MAKLMGGLGKKKLKNASQACLLLLGMVNGDRSLQKKAGPSKIRLNKEL
ncbi:hypothetical protein SAMN05660909_04235 [Chitinophaga terrae (ex Kim and Jung 2007)]|uniref:Uncharacterized protein n=1 Tax=Chitinophaga terrae (ex Kim and Jung 2007) TaxID=408074 RepID=A0A1H4F9T9_9BACT|nr:hypothetical protein [Chitinophaga terrae (ex Kim and Jung 2007)]SEA93640.1 hypothetical protein SAMN05660909_04235 [Chitinophaga terrae (ex Kim and Jung 2007)]